MTLALLAALLTGVLVAVQAAVIGAFGAAVHPFVASVWVHFGGLAFGMVALVVLRLSPDLVGVRQAPWGLLAGVIGVLLVTGVATAIGGLGLGTTLAVVTGTQLLVAFGLEAAGVGGRTIPIDPVRVLGAALIVVGVLMVFARRGSP